MTVVFALGLLYAIVMPLAAEAEVVKLRKGQPAPYDGVLFDESATIRADVTATDLAYADAIIAALRKQVEGKDAEIEKLRGTVAELLAANRLLEMAKARADGREEVRREMDDRHRADIATMKEMLAGANKRIETLESRMFWERVLSVLGPIGLLIGYALIF